MPLPRRVAWLLLLSVCVARASAPVPAAAAAAALSPPSATDAPAAHALAPGVAPSVEAPPAPLAVAPAAGVSAWATPLDSSGGGGAVPGKLGAWGPRRAAQGCVALLLSVLFLFFLLVGARQAVDGWAAERSSPEFRLYATAGPRGAACGARRGDDGAPGDNPWREGSSSELLKGAGGSEEWLSPAPLAGVALAVSGSGVRVTPPPPPLAGGLHAAAGSYSRIPTAPVAFRGGEWRTDISRV